ncbi:MAG: hydrogenase maturation protease [Halodesulfurarchaeum sp.]
MSNQPPVEETDRQKAASRAVIGLGNPLRGDDGVVPVLFEALRERNPTDIEILEHGDANLRLVHALEPFDRVLFVDAVSFGTEPGEWVVFSPEEVISRVDSGDAHAADLLDVLALATELGEAPAVIRIFGVQPGSMTPGTGLSEQLQDSLPAVREALWEAIEDL